MFYFKVKGSNIYTVTIDVKGNNLIATCDCNAAKNGMACKHRISIITGVDSDVIENKQQVKSIPDFIKNTTEAILLNEINSIEKQITDLTAQTKEKKKLLAKILPI